ncbi:M1 family metallopeptidase [Streptomyces sp. TM32]|uniref:M1 family metallopeptidase n=1 Tax=Streptomyces sp. TM32 TaxID=1652669 RepID=UPI0020B131B8|nr:M1 family metallopeptidase [Streptomyces sp. TM32]
MAGTAFGGSSGSSAPGNGTSPAAAGTKGASSAGDSLFPLSGNGGYDVSHYDLKLGYDPKSRSLDGRAVITARTTQPLTRFNLDLEGLTVKSVKVNQAGADFRRDGQELVITPERPLNKGERFRVDVTYEGIPKPLKQHGMPLGWIATDDGAFVGSQPNGAMTWFPVNDHPKDKASYDFTLTVPQGSTAVANGTYGGQKTAHGRTTFRWKQREPMASYAATVAVGRFKVQKYTTPGGLEFYNAVDPREAKAWPAIKKLPSVLDWAGKLFGPYPFKSAGVIVPHSQAWGGFTALETQGRPLYPSSLSGDGLGLMVHESAHQWFGDSVSLKNWKDIWLNEGFATYAEWLYKEQHGGDSAQKSFDKSYSKPANNAVWKVPVASPQSADQLFMPPVYERGAMALHKLRTTVGDDTFFRILRSWASSHRGGNATTRQFISLAERLSHKDLGPLFRTWIHTQGKPSRP